MASIIRRKYKVTLPDGRTVTKVCKNWTIQYRDAAGKLKRIDGSTDKAVAKQRAAQLERAMLRGEAGLTDTFARHRAAATAEHIKDYVASLRAAGRDGKYVENVANRLGVMVDECPWPTLGTIDAASFEKWRAKRSASKVGGQLTEAPSAETLNQFLETARAFLNWCATTDRIEGVPAFRRGRPGKVSFILAGIAKAEGPTIRNRRALSDDELAKLIATAPAERTIVYRLGIATGLRRQEIEDLVWGDVRTAAIQPYIQLRAWATKARRADKLDIPKSLADDLRKLRGDAKDSAKVFVEVPPMAVWKADLTAAGILYKDGMGRQADFHGGIRASYCTRLHRANVPQAQAMRMMRVTDRRLLDWVYTDETKLDRVVLPELPVPGSDAPVAKAAGA